MMSLFRNLALERSSGHSRLLLSLLFVLAISAMLCAGAFAQTIAGFGKVSGVVQDPTGAVVPGARVVIDNAAKGIHRAVETSGAGVFDFPALIPASGYTITVTKEGF